VTAQAIDHANGLCRCPKGSSDLVKPIAAGEMTRRRVAIRNGEFYVDRFLAEALNVSLERWIKYEKIHLRKRYRERCK